MKAFCSAIWSQHEKTERTHCLMNSMTQHIVIGINEWNVGMIMFEDCIETSFVTKLSAYYYYSERNLKKFVDNFLQQNCWALSTHYSLTNQWSFSANRLHFAGLYKKNLFAKKKNLYLNSQCCKPILFNAVLILSHQRLS